LALRKGKVKKMKIPKKMKGITILRVKTREKVGPGPKE